MGSSQSHEKKESNRRLITMSTDSLKERLNRIYDAMRRRDHKLAHSSLFDYLWELKELALTEGRETVEVPPAWLEDLEQGLPEHLKDSGRAH